MPRSIRAYYDRTAPYYDLTRRPFLLGRRAAIRLLDLAPGQDVLEIGAGTGHNLQPIATRIRGGRLTLLDFSVDSLRIARGKASPEHRVHTVACDAEHLPLTGRFDRILFAYSLSLMSRPLEILAHARTYLKPTGRLVVADFGPMRRWGPARKLVHWWLSLHDVRPLSPALREFASRHGDSHIETIHLGYTLLASFPAPPVASP